MKFVDWESRPAVTLAGRAWAVLEPGGDWVPVHGAEVGDSGRLLNGEDELRALFSDWGALPPLPSSTSKEPTKLYQHTMPPRTNTVEAMTQRFGAAKPNSGSLVSKIGVALILIVYFGYMSLGIETMEMMPPNAQIFVSYSNGTYASPPCVFNGTTDVQYIANLAEVKRGGVRMKLAANVEVITKGMLRNWQTVFGRDEAPRPDERCRNDDGFVGYRHSWLISKFGFSKSRWAANGEWLW